MIYLFQSFLNLTCSFIYLSYYCKAGSAYIFVNHFAKFGYCFNSSLLIVNPFNSKNKLDSLKIIMSDNESF